jgi:hypothetical protein
VGINPLDRSGGIGSYGQGAFRVNQNPNQQYELSLQYIAESVESSIDFEGSILDSTSDWIRFVLNILIFRTSQLVMTGLSLCGGGITHLPVLTLNRNVNMENN